MSDARALDRISLLSLLRARSEPARPCPAKRPLLRPAPYQPWQPIPAAVTHGARRDAPGVAVADQARALEARHDGEEDRSAALLTSATCKPFRGGGGEGVSFRGVAG